jgi:hypothetical protein
MAIVQLRIYRQFIQNSSPDVTLASPVDESEEDLLTGSTDGETEVVIGGR